MPKITLALLEHRNAVHISIKFDYDDAILKHVKKLEDVCWSKTHKTFYLPYNVSNKNRIFEHFVNKGWFVDYSALPRQLPKPVEPVFEKKELGKLTPSKSAIVEAFRKWMMQQRYSDNTSNTYCSLLKTFLMFYDEKEIDEITEKDIVRFNQHYVLANNYSRTFQNQMLNALKLFYIRYNNTSFLFENIKRPRKEKRLPEVLSPQEVYDILKNIKNVKHRSLLILVYACGLRIGEALNLKLTDIDSKRGFIHIKHAKGAKDRYVPLSAKTYDVIKQYYKIYEPKTFLFEGEGGNEYTQSSARKILRNAIAKTDIKKHVTLHTLRHSFATHLLENGTDIRYIQSILGHNSPKTTMIYTHVSTTSLKNIKNPFDDIDI
ncbi:MAG TPA: site-specific tyrosine recombinase/integron integrase [Salinimicrobium sp.]|nr:site-specific tyrosine recombinase/integron integrase [Salinimicrobium sp.]